MPSVSVYCIDHLCVNWLWDLKLLVYICSCGEGRESQAKCVFVLHDGIYCMCLIYLQLSHYCQYLLNVLLCLCFRSAGPEEQKLKWAKIFEMQHSVRHAKILYLSFSDV